MNTKEVNIILEELVPQGFTLPNGFKWDVNQENEIKEGNVTVYDTNSLVYARLVYHNDKLNGICRFYQDGCLKKKITYVDDVVDGWGCDCNKMKEVTWFMYVNGEKISELTRCENKTDYWKEISCETKSVLSISQYDENHMRHGKCYLYNDNAICEIVEYIHGDKGRLFKTFNDNEMIEYNEEGNVIYKGGFEDSFDNDYCRNEEGIEWVNGMIDYRGEWKNNKRCGEGISYRNGDVLYEGTWEENVPYGNGYVCNENGELQYEGEWVRGLLRLNSNEYVDYAQGKIERKNYIQKSVRNKSELQQLLNNEDMKRTVKSLVIENGCGNDIYDDLKISGFDWLESINFRYNTLCKLNKLIICDNANLRSISTDNGNNSNNGTCSKVKNVELYSIC